MHKSTSFGIAAACQSVYCDDQVVISRLVGLADMEEDLAIVPRITRTCLLRRGLQLNWARHKSAVMACFSGTYKQNLWQRASKIQAVHVAGDDMCYLSVSQIQLGNVITPDLATGPDLKHRKSCAAPAIRAFKRFAAKKAGLPSQSNPPP